MDLIEKTMRAHQRPGLNAVGRAIIRHMVATAYRRALASLNDYQLGKLRIGREPIN